MIPPSNPNVSAGRLQTQQEQQRSVALRALLDCGSNEVTYERALALIELKGLSTNAAAGALAHLAIQGHVRMKPAGPTMTFVEIKTQPPRLAPAAPPSPPSADRPAEPPVPMPPASVMPSGVLLARDAYRGWLEAQAQRHPVERCAEGLAVALRLAEIPERSGVVSSAGLRLTFELRHLVGVEGDARGAIQAAERHLRPPYQGPLPPCGCDHPEPRWCRGCGSAAAPLTTIAFHKAPTCACPAHPANHRSSSR